MSDFIKSAGLMLALLNAFMVIIYLVDLVGKLGQRRFAHVFTVACAPAGALFTRRFGAQ